jgi:hypothetical protein
VHSPKDSRLPGDYSHLLQPEKPKEPQRGPDGRIIEETTYQLHRPALTKDELHDIGVRNRDNKDVIALLHEIKRLRAHVLRADQFLRSTGSPSSTGILKILAGEIQEEPCVQELREAWGGKSEVKG